MSRLAVIAIACVVLCASIVLIMRLQPLKPTAQLPVLDTLGGDFALPSTLGHEIRLSALHGKLVLLNFGYTSCPSVCPTVLLRMRHALLALGANAGNVQPIFVTIDPERDTLATLAPYVRHFHDSFIAMRGSAEATRDVAALFKVYFERENGNAADGSDYGFMHSDHIYLIDRAGRVRATFANNAGTDQIRTAMETLLDE